MQLERDGDILKIVSYHHSSGHQLNSKPFNMQIAVLAATEKDKKAQESNPTILWSDEAFVRTFHFVLPLIATTVSWNN